MNLLFIFLPPIFLPKILWQKDQGKKMKKKGDEFCSATNLDCGNSSPLWFLKGAPAKVMCLIILAGGGLMTPDFAWAVRREFRLPDSPQPGAGPDRIPFVFSHVSLGFGDFGGGLSRFRTARDRRNNNISRPAQTAVTTSQRQWRPDPSLICVRSVFTTPTRSVVP